MRLRLVRHLPLPIGLMVIGGFVAKHVDVIAGGAIVSAGTLMLGRLMQQPRSMRKGPPDAA